jgi:hypothetical protein
MVHGLYGKKRNKVVEMFKLKMPKMPKIKMPNVVGNVKDMGKKIKGEIGNKTKGAVKGIKGLNPFKK